MTKNSLLVILVAALVMITASLSVGADSTTRPVPRTNIKQVQPVKPSTPATQPSSASQLKPLHQSLRLTPAQKMRLNIPRFTIPVRMEQLEKDFTQMSEYAKTYEEGISNMPGILRECSEKAYTVQDQSQAGCTGSDTVDQCREKLAQHCLISLVMADFSLIHSQHDRPNTPLDFSNYAEVTANRARELSRKLMQYAQQAERHKAEWDKAMGLNR